jgi:hypothetical protein
MSADGESEDPNDGDEDGPLLQEIRYQMNQFEYKYLKNYVVSWIILG